MAKGEKDVLASREKYDHDNWHAANIIVNSEVYPPVMKTWAEMIIAKGRPVKRGENRVLVDLPKAEKQAPVIGRFRLAAKVQS